MIEDYKSPNGKETWPVSFPNKGLVQEYLYSMEYAHPGIYDEWYKNIMKNGFDINDFKIDPVFVKEAIRIGLVKPIFIETSDDEAFILIKLWASLEEDYKWPNAFDSADLFWFNEIVKHIGISN